MNLFKDSIRELFRDLSGTSLGLFKNADRTEKVFDRERLRGFDV